MALGGRDHPERAGADAARGFPRQRAWRGEIPWSLPAPHPSGLLLAEPARRQLTNSLGNAAWRWVPLQSRAEEGRESDGSEGEQSKPA